MIVALDSRRSAVQDAGTRPAVAARAADTAAVAPATAVTPVSCDDAAPAVVAALPRTMTMHVQLRPRHADAARFWASLRRVAAAHAAVEVETAGLQREHKHLRVVLAVDLGPADLIARRSEQALLAFGFVKALFEDLAEHLPQYAPAPTDRERMAALAATPPIRPVSIDLSAGSGLSALAALGEMSRTELERGAGSIVRQRRAAA